MIPVLPFPLDRALEKKHFSHEQKTCHHHVLPHFLQCAEATACNNCLTVISTQWHCETELPVKSQCSGHLAQPWHCSVVLHAAVVGQNSSEKLCQHYSVSINVTINCLKSANQHRRLLPQVESWGRCVASDADTYFLTCSHWDLCWW